MPRRRRADKREILPDGRYNSRMVTMFVNKIMERGKKSTAERIMYSALDKVETTTRKPALETFEQALRNATPTIEVKPRRVGGATYQVPVDIRAERRTALAIRWLLRSAQSRGGRSMVDTTGAGMCGPGSTDGRPDGGLELP